MKGISKKRWVVGRGRVRKLAAWPASNPICGNGHLHKGSAACRLEPTGSLVHAALVCEQFGLSRNPLYEYLRKFD